MRTIAIVNQKGGCGKTTTALNLSAAFAARRYRTLLVDLDPQSHCAAGLGIPEERIELDVGDALLASKDRPPPRQRLLWRVAHNLDLLPSRMRLAGVEASRGGLADHPERERRLAMALDALATADETGGGYDVVIVDCPPSIGLLTYNALAAADDVVVPVETSYFSLRGATKQVQTVRSLGKRFGTHPRVRLVATIHNRESTLARDLLRELRDRFGEAVLPGVIRDDGRIREAASLGRTVLDFAPESDGAQDHLSLCEWLIEGGGIEPPIYTDEDSGPRDDRDEGVHVVATAIRAESTASPAASPAASPLASAARPAAPAPVGDTAGRVRDRIAELAARAQELRKRATQTQAGVGRDEVAQGVAAAPVAPAATAPSRASVTTPVARKRSDAKAVALEVVPSDKPVPAQPLASVRSLFGVRRTSRGLLFVQPMSTGRQIAVAGSFNGWSPAAGEMKRNDELGVFELHVETDGTAAEYRLVVDGAWTCDPFNPARRHNEFGAENNLVAARV